MGRLDRYNSELNLLVWAVLFIVSLVVIGR